MLSDIDSSNIRSYESGRAMLSVQTLVRIAEALKCPPADFLDGISASMFTTEAKAERPSIRQSTTRQSTAHRRVS